MAKVTETRLTLAVALGDGGKVLSSDHKHSFTECNLYHVRL